MEHFEPSKSIHRQITSDPSIELDFSQFGYDASFWARNNTPELVTDDSALLFRFFPASEEFKVAFRSPDEGEEAYERCEKILLAGRAGEAHLDTHVYRTEVSYSRSDMASKLLLDDALRLMADPDAERWFEYFYKPKHPDCGTTELINYDESWLLVGTVLRNGQSLGFIRIEPHGGDIPDWLTAHVTKTVFVGEDIDRCVRVFKKRLFGKLQEIALDPPPRFDCDDVATEMDKFIKVGERTEPEPLIDEEPETKDISSEQLDPTYAHFHSVSRAYRDAHVRSSAQEGSDFEDYGNSQSCNSSRQYGHGHSL